MTTERPSTGVNAHIGTAEYNAAKEALRALTRTAAREWARYGITANIICPGAKTAASRRVFAQNPELEVAADASNPMGRLGDPETDIAPVAVFLASEESRYLVHGEQKATELCNAIADRRAGVMTWIYRHW